MRVDKDSVIPLYEQVELVIEENIKKKIWPKGSKLPSEKILAQSLDVSRGTLKRAISNLEKKKYLVQKQGLGTFVVNDDIEVPLAEGLYSFSEYLQSKNISYDTIILTNQIRKADEQISKKLDTSLGQPYLFLERIRKADNETLMLIQNNINIQLAPGIQEADFINNSLFKILESHTPSKISYSETHFAAISSDAEKSALFNVKKNSPLLYQEQLVHLESSEVIEFARVWLQSNRFSIGTILHRK